MKLWSIQTKEVATLLKTSDYRTDPSKCMALSVLPNLIAYSWMARQLSVRVAKPQGCQLPVWAWIGKPDLSNPAYIKSGEAVLIGVEVPGSGVLPSNQSLFNSVLNNFYIGTDTNFEEKYCRLEGSPPEARKIIEESWSLVFNLDRIPSNQQQACFWEIRRCDVFSIEPLIYATV